MKVENMPLLAGLFNIQVKTFRNCGKDFVRSVPVVKNKTKTLTFSQIERDMHLDISLLFFSVVLFRCLLIRGFICLLMIHQNGEMCQRAM